MLIALALAMKVAVPVGFMPVAAPGQLMVLVCTEFGPQHVAIDVPGMPAKSDDAAKTDQPCAFSGLGLAWLPGADALLLAAALVFILRSALLRWLPRGWRQPPICGRRCADRR
jgi:hypothetical protein